MLADIHMHIAKKFFTSLFALGLSSWAAAQEVWDWNRCLDYALTNNIQLKLDAINVALTDLQLKQDKLAFTPLVQAESGYTYALGRTVDMSTYQYVTKPVSTGNLQVSLSQPLFEGLKNLQTLKKSKLDLKAARLDNERLKQDIRLQVMNAYLNVLNAEEQLAQAKNQLERTIEQYDVNKTLVEGGALAERMLVDIEAQLASDEYNIVALQQQQDLAYMALKTVLQLDQSKDIKVLAPAMGEQLQAFPLEDVETIYRDAVAIRPEVESGLLKIESAKKSIKIARSANYPRLSFFSATSVNVSDQFSETAITDTIEAPFGYVKNTGEQVWTYYPITSQIFIPFRDQISNNFSYAFGLNLSIPIYTRRSGYFGAQRGKLALLQAELNQQNTEYTLYNNIKEAHLKAAASEQNYKAAQKSLTASEKSYEYAKERLAGGAISQLELNLAQNNLFIAQSRLTQAKYDYLFNVKVLDFYRGKPIDFE